MSKIAMLALILALIALFSVSVSADAEASAKHVQEVRAALVAQQEERVASGDAPQDQEQGGSNGLQGLDYSTFASLSVSQCLKNAGYVFSIPRGYCSTNHVDANLLSNTNNARAAGFQYVDTYMFPCPSCGNAAGQWRTLWNYFSANHVNVGMVWLDVEGTQYWKDQAYNRAFMNELMNAASGAKIGIYSSKYQWDSIFGSGYNSWSKYPMWYAHYDNNSSCSDFSTFGGWTKPTLKQFQGDVSRCGLGVDISTYC